MKKKGFTLSELLVVVVIIGVLSAVVLPKFSKVIETRKTTEAEELMSAVRTEQEARCTLSKKYTDQTSKLGSYKAGKNFDYSLGAVGMTASAKSGKYTLEMPSYADGRICCSSGCDNLNKNYPLCSDLTNTNKTPDYVAGNENCEVEIEKGKETPTEPEVSCPSAHDNVATYTDAEGCTVTTNWELKDYPTCWVSSTSKSNCPKKCEPNERDLDECAHDYGHWDYNPDVCKCVPDCDMTKQENLDKAQNCKHGAQDPNWVAGTWNKLTCTCKCPGGIEPDDQGQCVQEDPCPKTQENLNKAQNCERGAQSPNWVAGQWNWDGPHACDCDCPQGTSYMGGECIPLSCKAKLGNSYNSTTQKCTKATSTSVAGTWDDTDCKCQCPSDGSVLKNGQCVCPEGSKIQGNKCVAMSCNWVITENDDFNTGASQENCPDAPAAGIGKCTWARRGEHAMQDDTYWEDAGGCRRHITHFLCECN